MKKYVAGLMFSEDKKLVALIVKEKPDWQKGLLNGIGGKIEEGETSIEAMEREFREETGVTFTAWQHFLTMGSGTGNEDASATNGKTQQYNEGWSVDFYSAFTNEVLGVQTMTDEAVVVRETERLLSLNTIDNLKWIILLALDKNPKFTNVIY